jgi:hypothetical protein
MLLVETVLLRWAGRRVHPIPAWQPPDPVGKD